MLKLTLLLLLVLPWLNPFAPGPSPAVVPLLFSWACAAGLWLAAICFPRGFARLSLDGVAGTAWLMAGLVSAVIALLQYFELASAFAPWINPTPLGEAFGNLRQRNQFATLTNIALAALCWRVWRADRYPMASPGATDAPRPTTGWIFFPAFAGLAAALLAAGNAASSSRTGLLQLAVLCALALWWGGGRQPAVRRLLGVAVASYIVASVALPWLAGFDAGTHGMFARLRDGAPACSSRWLLWSNVLELIAQKPWGGWGWGELDFAHYAHLYSGPRFCEILDNAHLLPLHLAVELGIPAAILLCGAAAWWVILHKPWRETDPQRQLAWGVLALIGLHSLLEYPLWYGPFQIAVVVCVVVLLRSARADRSNPVGDPQIRFSAAQAMTASAAVSLIVVLSFAAWDYRRVSQIYLDFSERDPTLRDDTLSKISSTRLFRNQFRFAELNMTPLNPGNAQWTFDAASELLHYSPESRVIEKVIESATMLGLDNEALLHLARYRAAFPDAYLKWSRLNSAEAPPAMSVAGELQP